MKKIFTLFSILALCFSTLFAQQIDIYGLFYTQSGDNTQLVNIDNTTGNFTSQGVLSGVMAIAVGSSTFDQFNDRYIFWGLDNQGEMEIYHIDIANGNIVNNVPFGSSPPGELQYDLQYDKVYGFGNSRLQEVDIFSGLTTTVATINGINAYVVGSSTFDSNNSHYIIIGANNSGSTKLYTIDATTGAIVHSPNLAGINATSLHFDVQSNTLYGFYSDVGSQQTYWASINQETGEVTDIALVPELSTAYSGIAVGSSTYNQNTQSIVFVGVSNGQRQLFTLDVLTGEMTQAIPLEAQIIELEVSNTNFANSFYNKLSNTQSAYNIKSISIAPNPTSDFLTVDLPDNQLIQLLDASGRFIRTFEQHNGQLDISTLSSGAYWLIAKEENTVLKSLFIKE